MGVPVITLPGLTFAGRHSTTHLVNAGLGRWVTKEWEEYRGKAVGLATNADQLKEWRSSLRDQLLQSPVCEGRRFGAHLSVAFREMWKQWVDGHINNIEEWQAHIAVESLSDEKVETLTDGPEVTPLITVKEENVLPKEKIKTIKKGTDQKELSNNNMKESMINTEKLVQNSNGSQSSGKRVNGHSLSPKNDNESDNNYYIETKDGITICTPADTTLFTPYVLLEQEEWFDPELDFVRDYVTPGMQVVDAGACFGAYALPMAKQVDTEGTVYAFEPSKESCSRLEKSKFKNGLGNLEIVNRALGNSVGTVSFKQAETPELNWISSEGGKELSMTTLDAWWDFAGYPDLEVIKIDVNGMEADVLQGAVTVLKKTAPVVITSIGEDEESLSALRKQFKKMGYQLFEYIPGPGLLAEHDPGAGVDPYLMNLIGISDSRIKEFKESGWIFDESVEAEVTEAHGWKKVLTALPWTESKLADWEKEAATGNHEEYLQALNLLCAAEQMDIDRAKDRSVRSKKGAMMLEAAQLLIGLFNSGKAGISAAMTFSRIMNKLGKKVQALEMMKELMEAVNSGGQVNANLPFLPPLPEQDETAIQTDFSKWLTVRIVEGWIIMKEPSTYTSGEQEKKMLKALEGNPESSLRIEKSIDLFNHTNGEETDNVLERKGKYNDWFWNNLKKEKTNGISIIGKKKEDNGTPSEVVRTKIRYDYLNNGKALNFDIPKKELFRMKNIFIDHEYALPKGFEVKDDGIIVDIGANIGTFALYARQWNQNAMIHCFEPNPQVVPLLKSNTQEIKNITKDFIALGESSGELILSQHPVNTGQSTTSHAIKGANKVNVKVRNSGEALKEKGVTNIDVLKIDTEGAEVPILKGMKDLLPNTKLIMLEYHTEEDRREIDALLSDFCIYSTEIAMVNGIGTVKYISKKLVS
jgi:FkbM family methyltransferase